MSKRFLKITAENWLKKFYGESTSDYVSIEDIFVNTGREDKDEHVNRAWLYNMMSNLKPFGFFEKEYEVRNGVRATKGIRLTAKGRQVLSSQPSLAFERQADAVEEMREVSFTSVLEDVRALRTRHPEFDIIFDVRLKKEEEVSM
ncbi:hypothetical protein [Streptomyces lincolnensis]|uniref:hypothetical protein n=1 Tax=Streptomyces lincolnensis TaxID=1915 RepID=UPI0037D785A4